MSARSKDDGTEYRSAKTAGRSQEPPHLQARRCGGRGDSEGGLWLRHQIGSDRRRTEGDPDGEAVSQANDQGSSPREAEAVRRWCCRLGRSACPWRNGAFIFLLEAGEEG